MGRKMTQHWRIWLGVWCLGVVLFGAALAGAAAEVTSAPALMLFALIKPNYVLEFDPTVRFLLAVLGGVTVGWGVTIYGMIRAALSMGERGRPAWLWLMFGMLSWFVIDSSLSVFTGFPLNAVANSVFLVGMLVPVLASGALKRPEES